MDKWNIDGMSVDQYFLHCMDKEKYISLYNYAKSTRKIYGDSACLAASHIRYKDKEFKDLVKLRCNEVLCDSCIFQANNYCVTFEEAQGEESKGK